MSSGEGDREKSWTQIAGEHSDFAIKRATIFKQELQHRDDMAVWLYQ